MHLKSQRVPLTDLLDELSPIVRTCMLEAFTPNCCIATCKILKEVFEYFGYRARAVPVEVFIYNAAMLRLVEEQGAKSFPDNEGDRRRLFDQTGAWGVGIVPYNRSELRFKRLMNDYGGHLVLNVDGTLVDGSLQQAERPERGIILPPLLWFPAPSGFFAPTSKRQKTSGMLGQCMVTFCRLDDSSFIASKNWRMPHAGVPSVFRKIVVGVSVALQRRQKKTDGEMPSVSAFV